MVSCKTKSGPLATIVYIPSRVEEKGRVLIVRENGHDIPYTGQEYNFYGPKSQLLAYCMSTLISLDPLWVQEVLIFLWSKSLIKNQT